MTEVKQEIQDEKIPEGEKPPESDETPQPTVEELTQQLESEKQEKESAKTEISRLQGLIKAEQKRGAPRETIDALHKKIDDMQEWYATVADDLASKIGGEAEEPPTARKTYSQQLKDKRDNQPKGEQKIDPDVQEFMDYLRSQGLAQFDYQTQEFKNPLVKEAVGENRTPQEALDYLKDKIEASSKAAIKKEAEETAKTMFEQMLKDSGLTTSGSGGPSAPSLDTSSMTADEKLQQGFKDLTKKK